MKLGITSIILILILGAISTIGFLWLSPINHFGHHLCFVSMISGGDCPPAWNHLALLGHHLSGLQDFTKAIIGFDSGFLAFFIFLLLCSLVFIIKPVQQLFSGQRLFCQRWRRIEDLIYESRKQHLRWLTMHNKRDPRSLYWAA